MMSLSLPLNTARFCALSCLHGRVISLDLLSGCVCARLLWLSDNTTLSFWAVRSATNTIFSTNTLMKCFILLVNNFSLLYIGVC